MSDPFDFDDDHDPYDSYDDDDCDCSDYDADLFEGRAWCPNCGRRWELTAEEIKREIEFQADYMAQFEDAERDP
jgi:hypothetical protein